MKWTLIKIILVRNPVQLTVIAKKKVALETSYVHIREDALAVAYTIADLSKLILTFAHQACLAVGMIGSSTKVVAFLGPNRNATNRRIKT